MDADEKSTWRPFGVRLMNTQGEVPCTPPVPSLTREVCLLPGSSNTPLPSLSRSWMKTSATALVSPAASVLASVVNSTKRPSPDRRPFEMWPT